MIKLMSKREEFSYGIIYELTGSVYVLGKPERIDSNTEGGNRE